MTDYSIAEAKNNLPKLVDRAVAGEAVTITRRGKALVKIVPVSQPKGMSIDLEWLERVRVKPSNPNYDGQTLHQMMRDEDRY